MRSSDRVAKALAFEKPDKVPFIGYNGIAPVRSDILPLFPLTPNAWQPPGTELYPHVYALQLKFHVYHWKAKGWHPRPPSNWKRWKYRPHREIDEWDVIWEDIGNKTMGWPIEGPLKIWEDLDSDKFKIPDGTNPERYKLSGLISKLLPTASKFRMGLMENFLYERCHFLRGWQNFNRDVIRSPQKIRLLIDRLMPYYEGIIQVLHKTGAQAVFTTDDWGTQEDVLMSPAKFQEIFMDGYKRLTKLSHDLGMKFILHSCGNVGRFLPLFIEAGIDAMQFDSPRMTSLEIMQKYTGKMCYLGCCNIQTVYPHGTPQDVMNETLAMMEAVGAKDGGFIAIDYEGANSVLQVPSINIRTFESTVRKYGNYNPEGNLNKSNWPQISKK